MKKENKLNKCLCDGYWFPHRKGSKWCIHSTVEINEQDYLERGF